MSNPGDRSHRESEQSVESEQMDAAPALPPAEKNDQGRTQQAKDEPVKAEPGASAAEVDRLKAERDALLDRLARAQADFENTRKRLIKEQQEFKDFAVADALQALLPTLDSFDWALQTPPTSLEEFCNGIELIRRQLHDALGKLGLQPVPAAGELFDPRLHEAVEMADMTEGPGNRVVEELRRGYKLGDRLLRPAMVVVAGGKRD